VTPVGKARDAAWEQSVLRAAERNIAPHVLSPETRQVIGREAQEAKAASRARTRWHRWTAIACGAVAGLCFEGGLWVSPLPVWAHVVMQAALAAVVAIGAVTLADWQT